uniref:Uncharacterized protein n=1 Tax=Arcella intermedia TaxID=1963864 RepID=A0A6B2L1P0_9EUKA
MKYRNSFVQSIIQITQTCSELQQSERKARTELVAVTTAKNLLQSRVEDLEEKVKFGVSSSQAKEREEKLQLELNAALKDNAATARQNLEMHEQVKNMEILLQTKQSELDNLSREKVALEASCNLFQNDIEDKNEKLSVIKSELRTLQTTLVKCEETVQQLKRENKKLEMRANKTNDDGARLMEANKFFNAIPTSPIPVSPAPPDPSLSNSNLFDTPSKPIGASILPRSSKKSFQVHMGEVNSVAFSTNGALFATGGSERSVKIWDSYTLANRGTLPGAERTIMHVTFSPNDECVMASSNDNSVRVFSVQLGRVKHCLLGHLGKVSAAQFTIDNDKAVTGSHDRTLRIWDLQRRYTLKTIFCYSSCNDLCLSRESNMIISGHIDQQVRFWDVRSGDAIKDLSNIHTGQITGVTLSADGRYLVTSSRDNTIKQIDLRTYEVVQTYTHEGYRNGLNWTRSCMSPDGRFVASGSMDGTIYVWDTSNGGVEQILRGTHKTAVSQVVWHPAGYQLASVDRAGLLSFWG